MVNQNTRATSPASKNKLKITASVLGLAVCCASPQLAFASGVFDSSLEQVSPQCRIVPVVPTSTYQGEEKGWSCFNLNFRDLVEGETPKALLHQGPEGRNLVGTLYEFEDEEERTNFTSAVIKGLDGISDWRCCNSIIDRLKYIEPSEYEIYMKIAPSLIYGLRLNEERKRVLKAFEKVPAHDREKAWESVAPSIGSDSEWYERLTLLEEFKG